MPNVYQMSGLLAIVIIIASILALVVLICLIVDYLEFCASTDDSPKIKFSTFLSFYELNPSRWELSDSKVRCRVPRKDVDRNLYGSLFDSYETFAFNYIDTCRYRSWYENLQSRKTEQINDKATARMLEAVKQDIADMETNAKREQNEGIEILKNIINT